jgi:hypothetical protein
LKSRTRQELVPVCAPLTINHSLAPVNRGQFIFYTQNSIHQKPEIHSFIHSKYSISILTFRFRILPSIPQPSQERSPHPIRTPNLYKNHPILLFLRILLRAPTKSPKKKNACRPDIHRRSHTNTSQISPSLPHFPSNPIS